MRFKCPYLVSWLLFSSFLLCVTEGCWGPTSPGYGDVTKDYDLLVGSELVLNCTLKSNNFKDIPRPISSSDLVFEKGDQDFSSVTRKIDDLTIQLRIPKAKETDSGLYHCKIVVTSNRTKPLVCSSAVSVGSPPKSVTNFGCISRNYDNLTCSWQIENNRVKTDYKIVTYIFNLQEFPRNCPNITEKQTSCEWTSETDPSYQTTTGNVSFTVRGNNSLGNSTDEFILNGFEIVIPNSPEMLQIINLGSTFISIGWSPPQMRNFAGVLPLQYEIWIGKHLYNPSDIQVFNIENNASQFIIENLIPYVEYNVSVRCKSIAVKTDDMWSPIASLVVKTLADVPYKTPEVIPEAYELHLFDYFRSVSLYWKSIPDIFHNGENFYYLIKYFQIMPLGDLYISSLNASVPMVEIKNLMKNASYAFHVYSVNHIGISEDYESVFVDKQNRTLPGPTDIRAVSQDLGYYNLSWSISDKLDAVSYTVFWCPSSKPWLSRCDSPVEWVPEDLTEKSIILNLTDIRTNFQFAVVAKTEDRSSGMQWASCIVPHKAALGKIRSVRVEPKNATDLKVIWFLDCPAQKAVVNRYEIIYCRILKNEGCKVATVEPNSESYLLQHLHPFSNYSIKIRAFNKDNLPSEDSDAVLQTTSPGAPAGPPQNVKAYSRSNGSFHVSWMPPLEPNGIITKYIISYNDSNMGDYVVSSQNEFEKEVVGLKPFTTYSVQIQACVKDNLCSVKSESAMIRTDVGEPGYMDPPRIETVNSTHLKVSWTAPVQPNGPIDFYVIEWHEDGQNTTPTTNSIFKVPGSHSAFIDLKCSRLGDGGVKYHFYIRAVNVKNEINLFGPLSEQTQATACIMSQGLAMIIGIAIGGTLALAFLVLLIYKLVKWMREKIHQVKSITIRLPKGLEGPETNPLNNYEYFKNGLNQNGLPNSADRHSYIIDDNENKNRHGSGSSQFSNSSTDELIFKNGKCTKFGRKPSGDSSGCSSMSSNTTPRTHLSSDSGTESDFAVPPSPDSGIIEHNLQNTHKPPLPILMEVHDQPTLEQLPLQQPVSQPCKHKNVSDDMILKVDHPYSKFGISGNASSSVPWRVNPLAFYSCNLANSEPSVFDLQNAEVVPYSKVGLAKSSGDILGISSMKEIGYSKFGCPTPQQRFSIPPLNFNPIAMLMVENPEPKEWPNIKKFLNKNIDSNKIAREQPLNIPAQNLVEDCGYIKVGMGNAHSKKPSPGYVPFNDLRDQQGHSPLPVSINTSDIKKFDHSSLVDKDQADFSGDMEWPLYNQYDRENRNIINGDTPEILFDVPILQTSINGSLMGAGAHNSDSGNFKLPYSGNSDATLNEIPSENSNSLPFGRVNENPTFLLNQPSYSSNTNHIALPIENSSLESRPDDKIFNPKTDYYDLHNEVVVTPMTLRNGYVPFSSLSDALCDRTLSHLPNVPKTSTPLSVFPHSVCTEADNYVTPSNKGDLRLLRDESLSKSNSVLPTKQKDSFNDSKTPLQNVVGYVNGSLKYILKPLPKMESEICEV